MKTNLSGHVVAFLPLRPLRSFAACKAPPCTHGASGAEDTAAGQKGNLVPSGYAPPATQSASGGEDTAMGRRAEIPGQRSKTPEYPEWGLDDDIAKYG